MSFPGWRARGRALGDVVADVLVADVAMEIGTRDELCGLMARAAQQEVAARSLERQRELLEGAQARRIQRGHVAKAQDDDGRKRGNGVDDRPQFVRGAEQKGAMDAEDPHIGWNRLILQRVDVALLHVFIGHGRHRGRIGHALDEQQGGAHHADADGLREIREYGQRKRHYPDHHVGFRQAQQFGNFRPVPML